LHRREFLKGLGIAGIAVVTPSLVLPKPRTIISPEATLFLPPPSGWVLAGERLETLVGLAQADARRMVKVSALNGEFPSGTVLTLQRKSVDMDGNEYLVSLQKVVVGTPQANVLFSTVDRAADGLEVLIAGSTNVRTVRLHEQPGWAGDFERWVRIG